MYLTLNKLLTYLLTGADECIGSASEIHGLTSTPIASVFQNPNTSTGVASLTWQTWPFTCVSPDGPPPIREKFFLQLIVHLPGLSSMHLGMVDPYQ